MQYQIKFPPHVVRLPEPWASSTCTPMGCHVSIKKMRKQSASILIYRHVSIIAVLVPRWNRCHVVTGIIDNHIGVAGKHLSYPSCNIVQDFLSCSTIATDALVRLCQSFEQTELAEYSLATLQYLLGLIKCDIHCLAV